MYPTQPPDPNEPPQGYYSVGGGTDRGIRPSREGIFKWIKRGMFGLTVLAIIGGSLYGVNHFFGVAEVEREKLALAREANDAAPEDVKVYFGDGSDILEIAPATEIVACPSGYDEKGESCQKTETVTASAAIYSCPSGYTKKGEGTSTTCVKVIGGTTDSKSAIETLSCITGYNRVGDTCAKTETVEATIHYQCPTGYATSGTGAATKCTKTSTQNGTVVISCPSGYSRSGSGCARTVSATLNQSAPTCSSGTVEGSSCVSYSGLVPSYKYTCPSGYTMLSTGTTCRRAAYNNTFAPCVSGDRYALYYCYRDATRTTTMVCPANYTRISTERCKRVYGPVTISSYYTCSGGVKPSGSSCTYWATPIYSCETGFAKAGSGTSTTCSRINITNVSVTTSTSCPSGYTSADGKCQRTVTVAPQKTLGCSDGYTLTGSKCIRIVGGSEVTAQPTITYKCPSGYASIGSGASMTCEKKETSTTEKTTQYQCEDGWTRRQAGTTFDCVLLRA
jgi:conjugal transfer mating pair stabilization protein TraN